MVINSASNLGEQTRRSYSNMVTISSHASRPPSSKPLGQRFQIKNTFATAPPNDSAIPPLPEVEKNSRPHGLLIKKEALATFVASNHIEIFEAEASCETSGRATRGCPLLPGMWVNIQRDTALPQDQERI
ncbi:hypothetical protein CDAR_89981 [Caerostris darwini]|uniref:Uncharacterized protein n=1 Tax=Caerostris darwini TaxID=1538125 RepID=A0AAV4RI06_9ARAC|nr:hypothetical protein CDAR_89981 [Caerostris darwini]